MAKEEEKRLMANLRNVIQRQQRAVSALSFEELLQMATDDNGEIIPFKKLRAILQMDERQEPMAHRISKKKAPLIAASALIRMYDLWKARQLQQAHVARLKKELAETRVALADTVQKLQRESLEKEEFEGYVNELYEKIETLKLLSERKDDDGYHD